ncbi:transposase [Bacillus sp. 2205SS5-2]|uniref:transposase n=1 Tax=Bacillus sp. 2205SS5-2 TaxID=3109031 RepID=UPI003FA5F493
MNLVKFQKEFSSEVECQDHLFRLKWKNGYQCDKCDHSEYYLTFSRKNKLYECKMCRYQFSWSYLITPVIIGSVIIVFFALIINNLRSNRESPAFWI